MTPPAERPLHPATTALRWHDVDIAVASHVGNQVFELGLADREKQNLIAFLQPRTMVFMVTPDPDYQPEPSHQ